MVDRDVVGWGKYKNPSEIEYSPVARTNPPQRERLFRLLELSKHPRARSHKLRGRILKGLHTAGSYATSSVFTTTLYVNYVNNYDCLLRISLGTFLHACFFNALRNVG